jgi:hypothetical protein
MTTKELRLTTLLLLGRSHDITGGRRCRAWLQTGGRPPGALTCAAGIFSTGVEACSARLCAEHKTLFPLAMKSRILQQQQKFMRTR